MSPQYYLHNSVLKNVETPPTVPLTTVNIQPVFCMGRENEQIQKNIKN